MPGSFWLRVSSDFESPTRLRKAYTFRSKRQDARRFYRFVCERRFLRWAQSTAKSDQLFVLLSAAILKSALWNVSGHAKAPLSKSHHSLFKSELLIQKSDSADSNDSTTGIVLRMLCDGFAILRSEASDSEFLNEKFRCFEWAGSSEFVDGD